MNELSVFPACDRKSGLDAYIFNVSVTYLGVIQMWVFPLMQFLNLELYNYSIHNHFGIYSNIYAPVAVHYPLVDRCFFSFVEKPCTVFHL